MKQDQFSGLSSGKILHFDQSRIKGWSVGTVVVSLEKTRSAGPGEAGVIVHCEMSADGNERYLILFESMGFDEWDASRMAKKLQIIPNPRASLLKGYAYTSLPQLEEDIAQGKLQILFQQVNTVADRFYGVVYSP